MLTLGMNKMRKVRSFPLERKTRQSKIIEMSVKKNKVIGVWPHSGRLSEEYVLIFVKALRREVKAHTATVNLRLIYDSLLR